MFHNMDFGWMGFGLIFWLILIVVIVYIVIKISDNRRINLNSSNNALEILKKRYAKGEITKDQYEQMKIVLS